MRQRIGNSVVRRESTLHSRVHDTLRGWTFTGQRRESESAISRTMRGQCEACLCAYSLSLFARAPLNTHTHIRLFADVFAFWGIRMDRRACLFERAHTHTRVRARLGEETRREERQTERIGVGHTKHSHAHKARRGATAATSQPAERDCGTARVHNAIPYRLIQFDSL